MSKDKGLTHISSVMPKLARSINGPTPIEKRLIDGAAFRIENPDGHDRRS
jgi:hypothetical protein